ncbi:MAG: glycosyltransferase [Patescibacteria group bacterium]|nr:glycosyltransferase [Patescibacteria group bacterium]
MSGQKPILLMVTSQDWGGAQAYVFNLAKSLKDNGLPVVVCAGGKGELGEKCRESDLEFINLKWMARNINPLNNFLSLFELIQLFRRLKPQAVHLNSTMMGVIGSLAARLTSVPQTIYVAHGWVFNEKLFSWKKSFYIAIEKLSSRWKNVIICINPQEELQAKSLNFKPRDKFITIPNGIDVNAFEDQLLDRNTARSSLDIRHSAQRTFSAADIQRSGHSTLVGTVANAYPAKNLISYLDVCAAVHAKSPAIKFIIIGDGPQMKELQDKHAVLKQESYVFLAGRRMDAPKLYRAFDIFVLPSTKEGMSITVLEAMAAHVPCITTDVGANKWMLEEAGIIVPPEDCNALAKAISKLSDDGNLRTSLATKAYEQVRQRFGWEGVVMKVLEVIKPNSL